MLSSSSSEEHSQSTIRRSPSSSLELVSNISSSSSSVVHQNHHNQEPPRAMEDVWKDISLPSFPEAPSLHNNPIRTTTFRPDASSFQDFLGRPFGHNGPQMPPQTRSHNNMAFSTTTNNNNASTSSTNHFIGSLNNPSSSSSSTSSPTMTTPKNHHPDTALCLNTVTEFRYIIDSSNNNSLIRPINPNPIPYLQSSTTPFESLGASFGKNGFPSPRESSSNITTNPNTTPAERKHKRLIKNRESAARSRARKQAYTNELEHTIDLLREENRKLMKQQEELLQAPQVQLPKKRSLQRSSTAPF